MLLGTGTHRYEWVGDWAKLPAGKTLGYTHGIRADRNDNLYLFNQSPDAVCVFDSHGQFIRSFGAEYAQGAHGLFMSTEPGGQFLYLTDYVLQRTAKHALTGELLWEQGLPPRPDLYPDPAAYKPTDVCVSPGGDIYIFDGYGLPYIHQYSAEGEYIRSIGEPGTGPGQLNCPHGGWVDTRRGEAELYVADRGNNRIQVFTLDGRHKRFITEHQQMPCNFFEFKGDLYIPDLLARVTILDRNDALIAHLGENAAAPKTEGWPNIQPTLQTGKFNSPHNLGLDSRGNLYVAEWISTGRLTQLRRVS